MPGPDERQCIGWLNKEGDFHEGKCYKKEPWGGKELKKKKKVRCEMLLNNWQTILGCSASKEP